MENNKKILLNFWLYILTFLIIIFIGVSNIFALEHATTYDDIQTYYDNNGSSVSQVSSTWNSSLNCYVSSGITTTANSYGAGVVINSPIPILTNHTYSLSFAFYQNTYSLALSSKNRIAIGNDIGGTAYNYANGNYYSTMNYSKVVNGNILQFAFTASGPASYIFIPWTTASTNTQIYALNTIVIEDLGSSGGVSESTINNSLNNQTTTINNYTYSTIQNSQQAIIDNNNSNKQAIINNQNSNNQALIDSNTQNAEDIIESQQNQINTCKDGSFTINTDYPLTFNKELNSSGSETSNSNLNISPYLNISPSTQYQINIHSITPRYACWYRSSKQLLSCFQVAQSSTTSYYTVTAPVNAYYLRVSFGNIYNFDIKGKICNNWQQEQLNKQTDAINGLNDSLNNDNTDGATSEASEFFSDFNTNTFGLTSIITAPLNLIQSLTSKTCSPLHLPLPYLSNKYLDLPCMSTIYSQHFGTFFTLYQIITYGIIAYWVCVRIFNHVKDFKNPEHDEIEVVDL